MFQKFVHFYNLDDFLNIEGTDTSQINTQKIGKRDLFIFITHWNFKTVYKPIFDVVTAYIQQNWYIMTDISKIRINDSMVPNFVMIRPCN